MRTELGSESLYPQYSYLIAKLSLNPPNLLTFFKQALQSDPWCRKHAPLLEGLFRIITAFSIKEKLPWGSVKIFCDGLIKYNSVAFNALKIDFDFTIITDKYVANNFTRLFLMNGVPILKQWFIERPMCREMALSEFACHLVTIEEFELLYKEIVSASYFTIEDWIPLGLMRLALQCKEWKLDELQLMFERALSGHIQNYLAALESYDVVVTMGLKHVQSICEKLLDSSEFYEGKTAKGRTVYTYYRALQFDETDPVIKIPFELIVRQGAAKFLNLKVDKLGCVLTSETSIFVGLREICLDEIERDIIQLRDSKKVKLDRNKLKKIALDGRTPVSQNLLFGMLHYFHNVDEFSLIYFHNTPSSFLNRIGLLKPNLKIFGLAECLETEEFINLIPHAFPRLVELKFHNQTILKESFALLLQMPNLKTLILTSCIVDFPDPELFSNLTKIIFSELLYYDEKATKSLFVGASNVESLSMTRMKLFELNIYPHPDKLVDLTIDCDQLEKNISDEKGTIPAIDRLTNLKELTVTGLPSDRLKPVLIFYMKRLKVNFMKEV